MKTLFRQMLFFSCVCGTLALNASFAQANEPAPRKSARLSKHADEAVNNRTRAKGKFNPSTGSNDGQETRVLTGSHLTKTYTVHGHTTDAAQPVYIIDRRDPRFDRDTSVGDALRRLPFASVGGR